MLSLSGSLTLGLGPRGSGGGAPAPTPALTSSDTLSVVEGQQVAESVTTNTSCYCYLEGEDAMSFELIGSQPGTSWTLRKLGDGTFDSGTPEDFDQDNIYDVTLALGPLAGGADILVPITVTVEALTLTVGTFTAQTGVTPSTPTESNVITVTALNVPSVTVTAEAGLEYQKNGGAWTSAAGTAALNDTFKARLTSSPSYFTLVEYDLTFNGNVARTFSVTTEADPSGVTWTPNTSPPTANNEAFGSPTSTFNAITFTAGQAGIVIVKSQSRRIGTVTVAAAGCTLVAQSAAAGDQIHHVSIWRTDAAVTAGSKNVVVTSATGGNLGWVEIITGTVDSSGTLTFGGAVALAHGYPDNPITLPSMTITSGQVGLAAFSTTEAATMPSVPTWNTGTASANTAGGAAEGMTVAGYLTATGAASISGTTAWAFSGTAGAGIVIGTS